MLQRNSRGWEPVLKMLVFELPPPAKIDLSKKWLPKQKTIQNFNIDAQGIRKTRNEIPPTRDIEVTS